MLRLICGQRLPRRGPSDDRGAIAVVTAVLGSAVLFACAAIAIDVGALYAERRQLQNGADAAAVAVAQSCARGQCDIGLAAGLADGNAVDGSAAVAMVCGTAPGLGGCPQAAASRTSCRPVPAGAPPYVEVRTRTRDAGGSGVVAPFFAPLIPGNEDYTGTTVRTCARAAYGSPGSAVSVLPVAVSQCLVNGYRARHGGFAAQSLMGSSPSVLGPWETQILGEDATSPCFAGPSGQTAPGNFGFLAVDGPCSRTSTVNQNLQGDPGNSNPSTLGCTQAALALLRTQGTVVYLPVFDTVTETGRRATYHIIGYAAFRLTGWNLNGLGAQASSVTGSTCNRRNCFTGIFVKALLPAPGPISSAPDHGATVVQLLG